MTPAERAIHRAVIHYLATPEGREVTVEEVDRWHRERGFRSVGYHYLVRQDGTVERGRPEQEVGAHVRGHNGDSVGIAYVGGLRDGESADTRTPAQRKSLRSLVQALRVRYPGLEVVGHRDLAPTECPGFDVQAEGWPHPTDERATHTLSLDTPEMRWTPVRGPEGVERPGRVE